MTVSVAAKPTPLPRATRALQFVDKDGILTEYGAKLLGAFRDNANAGGRIVPCEATGTNVITLTPFDATPLLEKYSFGDVFAFVGEIDSTGSVTATVVPTKGTLATLKVYVQAAGAAPVQAGAGDVQATSVYLALYADHLDSAAGGFVLK